jgi:nitrate reductase delta subunit
MGKFGVIAKALQYPRPGQFEALQREWRGLPSGDFKKELGRFLERIEPLSLGEWEELHTRTWDLNPQAIPYVGFHRWGESYQRGNFMSRLNREMAALNVERKGELPDHLAPVLRYLEVTNSPLPEVMENLLLSLKAMSESLKKAERDNPYRWLLNATEAACREYPQAVSDRS